MRISLNYHRLIPSVADRVCAIAPAVVGGADVAIGDRQGSGESDDGGEESDEESSGLHIC